MWSGVEVHSCEDLISSWEVLNLFTAAFSGPCRLEDLPLMQCICLEGTWDIAAQAQKSTKKLFTKIIPQLKRD